MSTPVITPSIAQSSSTSIENLAAYQQASSQNDFSNIEHIMLDEFKKVCYVCHSGEDENNDQFVSPCKCIGSLKWVHQSCIQMWLDTQLKNSQNNKISCPQCKTQYIVLFPNSSKFVKFLELFDKLISALSPFVLSAIGLGSVYWLAFSYGALTVCQTIGLEKCKVFLEQSDSITLFIFLPSMPLVLILSKLIRWEDSYLKIWKRYSKTLPVLKFLFKEPPQETGRDSVEKILLNRESFQNSLSLTRIFSSALLLPTFANLVGATFFKDVESGIHRALLGGLSFIVVKGLFKIYLRQSQYIKHSNRKILNFHESNQPDASKADQSSLNNEVNIEP